MIGTKVQNDRYKLSKKCKMLATKVQNVNAIYTIYNKLKLIRLPPAGGSRALLNAPKRFACSSSKLNAETCNSNIMYAVVNNTGIIAKDFKSLPAAIHWMKQYNHPMRVISQNSKEYLKLCRVYLDMRG